jgi:magnesium-transporting ATPase (P-type)
MQQMEELVEPLQVQVRYLPEHKVQIVQALQQVDHILETVEIQD